MKLVDTHGAGDVLIGALAARWASGVPVPEAVHFANAAAALFVSTPSDQKKVVTSDQVTRFLFGRLFQSLFAKSGTRVTENSAAVHFGMRPQQRSQMFSTTFSLGETAHHEFLLRTRLNLQPILSRIGFCLTRLALRT